MTPLICRSCGDRWNTHKGTHLSWYLEHEALHGWNFPRPRAHGRWATTEEWEEIVRVYYREHMEGWPE